MKNVQYCGFACFVHDVNLWNWDFGLRGNFEKCWSIQQMKLEMFAQFKS